MVNPQNVSHVSQRATWQAKTFASLYTILVTLDTFVLCLYICVEPDLLCRVLWTLFKQVCSGYLWTAVLWTKNCCPKSLILGLPGSIWSLKNSGIQRNVNQYLSAKQLLFSEVFLEGTQEAVGLWGYQLWVTTGPPQSKTNMKKFWDPEASQPILTSKFV